RKRTAGQHSGQSVPGSPTRLRQPRQTGGKRTSADNLATDITDCGIFILVAMLPLPHLCMIAVLCHCAEEVEPSWILFLIRSCCWPASCGRSTRGSPVRT